MFKLLAAVTILFISIGAEASSVYERVLEKSFFKGDLKKARSMIDKGASITAIGSRIWYNNPSYKQVKFLIDNGYPIKSKTQCILEEILYEDDSHVKDLFKKTKLLVDNGVDLVCKFKGRKKTEDLLIFSLMRLTRKSGSLHKNFLTKERKKAILYILNKMSPKQISTLYPFYRYGDFLGYKKPLSYLDTDNNKFNRQIFKLMINKGTSINEPIWLNKDKTSKFYPINKAIYMGSLELVKFCLNKKANTDITIKTDNKDYNVLDYAHLLRKDNIELYLLEKGLKYHYFSELNPHKKGDRVELKGDVIIDHKQNLMWQKGAHNAYGWEDGKEYCKNLTLHGFDDWRLPTAKEFKNLSGIADKFLVQGMTYQTTTFNKKGKYFGAYLGYNKHNREVRNFWMEKYQLTPYAKCVRKIKQ